jgi:hypothetical protein
MKSVFDFIFRIEATRGARALVLDNEKRKCPERLLVGLPMASIGDTFHSSTSNFVVNGLENQESSGAIRRIGTHVLHL